MLTPTILSIIIALQLVTTLTIYVNALPITSKPIEGTAEHLAWQAWLMLPPEQKNLEKSRKVTPKSIFTLPFRECPPGHQLFENRCIPTVNIDETALLTQQLLGFVVGDGGIDSNYEFDYDDIGGDEIPDVMYEPMQNLNGDDVNNDTYHYDQLPSQDEPLKFNIFQQKFPTDYEAESMPSIEKTEEKTSKSNVAAVNATTPLATAINGLATKEPIVNVTQSKNNGVMDLVMDSSNVSMNVVQNVDSNNDKNNNINMSKSHESVTPTSTVFSISDIDAIALPAQPTHKSNLETNNEQNVHKFSLFKDDSSVQLVTSTLLAERGAERQQQPDLTQLLKADGLLPIPNIASNIASSSADNTRSITKATPITPESTTTTTTTTTRTRTSLISSDNGVPTSLTSFFNDAGKRTTLNSANLGEVTVTDVTDMMPADAESTIPTLLGDLTVEHDIRAQPEEPIRKPNLKKDEHPRSVTMQNAASGLTEAQEEKFTTTTEPDETTNFQLDETTVVEIHDAPTIALKELLELAQHPSVRMHENLGSVVKKSKVEPVELPMIPIEANTEIDLTATPPPSSLPTLPTNLVLTTTEETIASSTPIPTVSISVSVSTPSPTPTSTTITDRFDNQPQLDTSSAVERNESDNERQRNTNTNDEQLGDSNFSNIETTKTTTTQQASEIDIKQELRMINELVKGNSKRQQQIKGGIIKSVTSSASTSESGFTSVVKKSAKATTLSNNDKISGSLTQLKTTFNQKEESRTSDDVFISTTTTTATTIPLSPVEAGTETETRSEAETETETTDVGEQAVTTTITSPTTKSTSTASTASTTEPIATIWSKLMPLFGFSTSLGEITDTETTAIAPSEQTSTSETIKNTNDTNNIEKTFHSNRSNRNSKIIRINSLSTPSYSTNSDSANSISTTITPISTTTETDVSNLEISSSSSSSEDPFWWLPTGWHLDRKSDIGGNGEPSLLVRLWSAFPGSESTSKEER